MLRNLGNVSGNKSIRFEPCSCREHGGNMYQRVSCTENKIKNIKLKRQATYFLLWLYKEKISLTKDICHEIQKFF